MYLFNKYFHPRNFVFAGSLSGGVLSVAGQPFAFSAETLGDDIHRIRIRHAGRWPVDYNRSGLTPPEPDSGEGVQARPGRHSRLDIGGDGGFALKAGFPEGATADHPGRVFLATQPGAAFGICGKAWLFQFRLRPDMRFYGMGEKHTPFEKGGRTHRFWNTDVWDDHGSQRARDSAYDPDYISVPWMIVKRGNTYAGILLDNPHPSVISIAPSPNVANQMKAAEDTHPLFYLGAEDGEPSLYILFGPTLPQLLAKFQKLTGPMPVPPLWALGHHQCRWGYRSPADLHALADGFDRHRFPNDGLWLDIDYMRGYRVFTFDPEHFPDPAAGLEGVRKRGYRVVPILDPGVKQEEGFEVHDDGKRRGVFCRNEAGTDFTGLVWPGYTVFPDFSLERTRAWWAERVAGLAERGVDGVWLDMNDPSTGQVDCQGMFFDEGRAPHHAFHNQYASLMAEATYRGFLQARPDARPFLLSRSGFTGDQKYTAHWTGDNWSNRHHLHVAIGKCLNLSMSGMALVGPDVPGFGGDATEELFIDWYKAGFLFPFFRNHCMRGMRDQEPWAFSAKALDIARRHIRLRYKLLPYLYNLFIAHAERGEAVMRPLFHDFPDRRRMRLDHVNDQFLAGPWIMQAPFTAEGVEEREILLPGARWWRADEPGWVEGPTRIIARKRPASTPIFLREGALLPMLRGVPETNRKDLLDVELLVVLSRGSETAAAARYACDDGETFAYRRGIRSIYGLEARADGDRLVLRILAESEAFGKAHFTPVTLDRFREVVLETPEGSRPLRPREFRSDAWGAKAAFREWA